MSEWRTIESAPKDGSIVLLCFKFPDGLSRKYAMWTGAWRWDADVTSQEWRDDENGEALGNPTHWMPLPLPPSDSANDHLDGQASMK